MFSKSVHLLRSSCRPGGKSFYPVTIVGGGLIGKIMALALGNVDFCKSHKYEMHIQVVVLT